MKADYEKAWLLYLGNALFMAYMFVFAMMYNISKRDPQAISSIAAAHVVTFLAIAVIFVVSLLLVFIMVPGLVSAGPADRTMSDTPVNMVHGKTNGMLFILYIDMLLGNFAAGSFVAIITSYMAKKGRPQSE
ncbi:hypothetical protein DXN05_23610 [Deminuibacter soli]|uniref:DUF4199 domain-containing protein n=2 Tax=Deminuibacter soli TaxID=2291815 RepID=A0A3E1NCN6_9BACT|nr:hypothetical protein DXN05_23610 [Deminuibacter soli]